MLDYRILTFLKVCEHMSFSKAANELHLSQPAVSQHIKYLENEYTCDLFVRHNKSVILTKSGQMLYQNLQTMKNDEEKLKKQLKTIDNTNNIINFGVTLTIGEYALVSKLISYIKCESKTNFNIYYKNTNLLLSYLKNGKIDFAIIEGKLDSDLYNTRKIQTEKYIAVCSSTHVFTRKVNSIYDLLDEKLIVRENGSGTLAIFESILSIQNLSLDSFSNRIMVDNMHMIVELLKNDCGISFLYKSAVKEELENGVLREITLDNFELSHEFSFVWNKGSIFSDDYLKIYDKLIK
ncbi:LysR family transcriptional regulator [Peptostreptococcus equinus]|uniref:LysR family transcriptional regulator n=1 Tax=Peptostreptococcus equinus TaxID=3003601 RepID=A0ABY7JTB4_9FIRM|nr:LysR family transcriptional regulator [Peptostreptococcus sp. CBA3647]WAW15721.1 LysR family transcriptional regulator [Peptostreptococcus sp. CBA3647]